MSLGERLPFPSGRAKQFFFGLLNESEEMGVIDNAGCVDIRPVGSESSFKHQRILALRRRGESHYSFGVRCQPLEPAPHLRGHLVV